MDPLIERALAQDKTIDITTTGARTGMPRRIEIWFYRLDGRIFITGSPGRRHWYANLLAHPDITFHLKQSARADLPARATPITDPARRRRILTRLFQNDSSAEEIERRVAGSPLVEVHFG